MIPPYPQQRSCLLTWTFMLHEQNSSRKKRHRRIVWFFYEQECCVLITLWLSMVLNAFFVLENTPGGHWLKRKKKSLFFLKVKAIWRVKKCWHSLVVGREAEHGKGSVESCFICEQRFCANCTNLCSFRNTCVVALPFAVSCRKICQEDRSNLLYLLVFFNSTCFRASCPDPGYELPQPGQTWAVTDSH